MATAPLLRNIPTIELDQISQSIGVQQWPTTAATPPGCHRGPHESGLKRKIWRQAEIAAAWPGLGRACPPDRAAAVGLGSGA